MKKPLLLDGKPFDPNPVSVTFIRIREFLDKRPGEIFTFTGVKAEVKTGEGQVYSFARDARNGNYIVRGPKSYLFGTPSAIQQYRKMTEAAGKREG